MTTKWISEVKAIQAELGISYKEALQEASERRHKGEDLTEGSGALSEISRRWRGVKQAATGNRMNLKPAFRSMMDLYGSSRIDMLYCLRTPLSKGVKLLMKAMLIEIPHDELFHLSIVIDLESGTRLMLEKNEDLNLIHFRPSRLDEWVNVPIAKHMTLNEFVSNMVSNIEPARLFVYDPFSTNCQLFVLDALKANAIPISASLQSWILQPVDRLASAWKKRVARFFTDLANRGKLAIYGEGDYSDQESDSE